MSKLEVLAKEFYKLATQLPIEKGNKVVQELLNKKYGPGAMAVSALGGAVLWDQLNQGYKDWRTGRLVREQNNSAGF